MLFSLRSFDICIREISFVPEEEAKGDNLSLNEVQTKEFVLFVTHCLGAHMLM